jgi:murein DD-endopeptidase MepM/ murein hydrolase activator NlpD
MKAILTSLTLAVMLAMASYAATNPFSETEIKIEGSTAAIAPQTEFAAVERTSAGLDKEQLDQAIAMLEEANSNYSKLLRKFADDPSKFADENGDYRDFIKQLESLSRRLAELSQKPKNAPENIKGESEEKPADTNNAMVNYLTSTAAGGELTAAPCQPMPSRVSSEFGMRTHPTQGYKKMHNGIDLPVPNGTRLNSLGNGTVVAVGYESGGGKFVKVRYDNGYESFYCHLQSYSVRKGQRVSAGQDIARSDNTGQWTTGAHLHFGLKKNGKYVNPRFAGIPLP